MQFNTHHTTHEDHFKNEFQISHQISLLKHPLNRLVILFLLFLFQMTIMEWSRLWWIEINLRKLTIQSLRILEEAIWEIFEKNTQICVKIYLEFVAYSRNCKINYSINTKMWRTTVKWSIKIDKYWKFPQQFNFLFEYHKKDALTKKFWFFINLLITYSTQISLKIT